MKNIKAHPAFQLEPGKKGIMFAAGPFQADGKTT